MKLIEFCQVSYFALLVSLLFTSSMHSLHTLLSLCKGYISLLESSMAWDDFPGVWIRTKRYSCYLWSSRLLALCFWSCYCGRERWEHFLDVATKLMLSLIYWSSFLSMDRVILCSRSETAEETQFMISVTLERHCRPHYNCYTIILSYMYTQPTSRFVSAYIYICLWSTLLYYQHLQQQHTCKPNVVVVNVEEGMVFQYLLQKGTHIHYYMWKVCTCTCKPLVADEPLPLATVPFAGEPLADEPISKWKVLDFCLACCVFFLHCLCFSFLAPWLFVLRPSCHFFHG